MLTFSACQGQLLSITYTFTNPQMPGAGGDLTAFTTRFKVYDPTGRLFADSHYHTYALGPDPGSPTVPASTVPALPAGLVAGQLIARGGSAFAYRLSIPRDAPLGTCQVEVSATIDSYPVCLTIAAERLFAWAQLPSQDNPTDLLPLRQITLPAGWTQVVVSAELFMIPVVDRLALGRPYRQGERYANPYYQDDRTIEVDGATIRNPLADGYGPGPVFYLYAADPHWGGRDFSYVSEADQLVASASDDRLDGDDAKRLELICRPDFAGLAGLSFQAYVGPWRPVSLSSLPSTDARALVSNFDSRYVYLRQTVSGPGPSQTALAPEWAAGGPSDCYRASVETRWREAGDGGTDRLIVGFPPSDKHPLERLRIKG